MGRTTGGEGVEVRAETGSLAPVAPMSQDIESQDIIVTEERKKKEYSEGSGHSGDEKHMPSEDWLPITESRKGNAGTSALHLLCSGIGIQSLLVPVAFVSLGWFWGILCLSLAFLWQLYTIWLLVHLHESVPGIRYSRYLHLSIAAFGEKLGKFLAIFPLMYLSGGTCVMMIITGGETMEVFYQLMCRDEIKCNGKTLTGAEWFLVFICLAILMIQFLPNLNTVARASLIGAITGVTYCTVIWVLSIIKGRPEGVTYDPSKVVTSDGDRIRSTLMAVGVIFIAFRGHNLVLEIQGTMPSSPKQPSKEPMWRGVTMAYPLIVICLFPLAIVGYWAHGNMITAKGGNLNAILKIHESNTSKYAMGIIYILVVINCLCTFQIFAMPVFDNLEFIYTRKKNKKCPKWLRSMIRVFFGGFTFFVAVTFPFLPSLAALLGGLTLPIAYAYPCFMWIVIKKCGRNSGMWWFNLVLGCLGIVLSVLLVVAALWNLENKGLDANFFHPR